MNRKRQWRVLVGTLLVIAAAVPVVTAFGQTCATQTAIAVPAPATPETVVPFSFEVSTVKNNKSGSSHSGADFDDGRFTAYNVSLKSLLQYRAYGIPESRIFGGPKWISSKKFDIEAKMDAAVADRLRTLTRDQRRVQMQTVFQQLLADRFKLAVHWETRDLPVYAMVAVKKGPRLHPSKESDGHSGTHSNNEQFTAQNITLVQLADALTQEFSGELGRVVIDKTGILGHYDFALKWTPDARAALTNDVSDPSSSGAGPSLFTAIQEQLGLRLESTKGSVQVLVIDHVETPTEN